MTRRADIHVHSRFSDRPSEWYLERIVHVVAHPLFRVNDKLTVDHLEKLLVLFRLFEGANGTRDPRATELFDAVLSGMTPAMLAALAERHRLPPPEDLERPVFATTGGSDDHGGLYVATTWTETPLPRYEELTLRVPPLVEHCERERYGRMLISTPGPVGLTALFPGRPSAPPIAGALAGSGVAGPVSPAGSRESSRWG